MPKGVGKMLRWCRRGSLFSFFFGALLLMSLVGSLKPLSLAEPAWEWEEVRSLPEGFVYLDEVIPDAIYEVRYYTDYNFVGRRIDGYLVPRVVLTAEAAEALAGVAEEMRGRGLILKIFDGYRPQQAVDHFVRWAQDLEDQRMKAHFYPEVDKKDLFPRGYIAEKSGHSRGSTVDLTLADAITKEELDMGSGFDFFGEISHHDTHLITDQQRQNRELLRDAMVRHGFLPYAEEWWHYTLADEPYPDTYFDFPVQ
jgi:D-alanyl-D-alanine dipeptidase